MLFVLKYSCQFCENLNELFQAMFSDNKIAESFKLGKTKCGYFINYGLEPFSKMNLIKSIKDSPFFAASFDESLNRINQDEQMDVHIRYWDNEKGLVKTNYLDSRFVFRPNADNLHDELHNALQSLPEKNMLQLSMDGPNTNWKVFELLFSYRNEKEWSNLLNLGSCGLHIVHGAFQTGIKATNWEVEKVLKAMFKLFHDSPARRDLYIKIMTSDRE